MRQRLDIGAEGSLKWAYYLLLGYFLCLYMDHAMSALLTCQHEGLYAIAINRFYVMFTASGSG